MARIYLSSTYEDLKDCRQSVYRALRKMGHDVTAMEDYVATDQRPIEKCLADVQKCDVYIGVFAFRYGFIPPANNPQSRSITELELRCAIDHNKHCLLFFIKENALWQADFIDKDEKAARVKGLRAEFTLERQVGFFRGADDLATEVASAVHVWEKAAHPDVRPLSPTAEVAAALGAARQPREIINHAFVVYVDADKDFVDLLAQQSQAEPFKCRLSFSSRALFADTTTGLYEVEASVRLCHSAIVVLSDQALDQMHASSEVVRSILGLLRARTGHLIALCRSHKSKDRAADWGFKDFLDGESASSNGDLAELIAELGRALQPRWQPGYLGTVGLPYVVVSMTEKEAAELEQPEGILLKRGGTDAINQFKSLLASLSSFNMPSSLARYGSTRELWRPFAGSRQTIAEVLERVALDVNSRRAQELSGWTIKPQYYPLDPLVWKENEEERLRDISFRRLYSEIAETGCVILLDELSLFHPLIQAAVSANPLLASEKVSVVTIAPSDPYRSTPSQIIESHMETWLTEAFYRFSGDYDPQCEIGVGSERRLIRWLHSGLPKSLRGLRPKTSKLSEFTEGFKSGDMSRLLYNRE